jgi:hypothetical protein
MEPENKAEISQKMLQLQADQSELRTNVINLIGDFNLKYKGVAIASLGYTIGQSVEMGVSVGITDITAFL